MGGTGDYRWYDDDWDRAWWLQRLDNGDITEEEFKEWEKSTYNDR